MRASIIVTIVAIAVVAGGAGYWIAAAEKVRPRGADAAAMEKRVKDWAYIGRTKKLSDTEELTLITVPSPLGEMFDMRCLVYKNREFQQMTMTCPEATQLQLNEIDR